MADTTNPDCPFCDLEKIANPVTKHMCVRRNGELYRVLSFEPLNPVTPGHVLVVPEPHVTDLATDPDLSSGAMWVASRLAAARDHVNVITSRGSHATQTVKHLHLHVVPRSEGDGLQLPWSGQ